jgi:squalene-hopene/tetraprenyl-beta-curcumene cyclase
VFSTAAAMAALRLLEESRPPYGVARIPAKIALGLDWLVARQNKDGGWGDTAKSNLRSTACVWAVLRNEATSAPKLKPAVESSERWLKARLGDGGLTPSALAVALQQECNDDPALISATLALCALSEGFDLDESAWKAIPALAFESAAFSTGTISSIASAAPTLISVGQLLHLRSPSPNPLRRFLRDAVRLRTLKKMEKMVSEDSGYFDHVPTTSFVLMGLVGSGLHSSPAIKPCMEFLIQSQRRDGSWAVSGNLSIRLTSGALDALASPHFALRANDAHAWLLEQQTLHHGIGGWSWTSGGLSNVGDTASALLALRRVEDFIAVRRSEQRHDAAVAGIKWLAALQNSDGSFATFGKAVKNSRYGVGTPEITAQAIRALVAWQPELPSLRGLIAPALAKAQDFLQKSQQTDGSWQSLWFGSEDAPNGQNPIFATSRVILAIAELGGAQNQAWTQPLQRAVTWLLDTQLPQGGWALRKDAPATVEESALALEALAAASATLRIDLKPGIDFLLGAVESGAWKRPAPLGLFYGRHWYSEQLYPILLTVSALSRVERTACAKTVASPDR